VDGVLPQGTFSSQRLEMLRLAFDLLCAGHGHKAAVDAHQLPELLVLAGLDLSTHATRDLLGILVRRGVAV
jgi:hypothetical protein